MKKCVKVLEPSNCSKGLMCNFGKQAIGLLPGPLNLINLNFREKKGPEWDRVIIVEQKKENLQVQYVPRCAIP